MSSSFQFHVRDLFVWTLLAAMALLACRWNLVARLGESPLARWMAVHSDILWCGIPAAVSCAALARGRRRSAWHWWVLGWLIGMWCTAACGERSLQFLTSDGQPPDDHAWRPVRAILQGLTLAVACAVAPVMLLDWYRGSAQPGSTGKLTQGDVWLAVAVLASVLNVLALWWFFWRLASTA